MYRSHMPEQLKRFSPNDFAKACASAKNLADQAETMELVSADLVDMVNQVKNFSGFGLKAIYDPPMFHINHGSKGWGGGGFAEGINKKANDIHRAITFQETTNNLNTWGFSDIEIEFEVL